MIIPWQYIESIKSYLIDSQWVVGYKFLFERATDDSAFVRARVFLADESILHFSEYSELDETGALRITTYSYHWMIASNELLRRWDNTPHYPDLPGFPDHIHDGRQQNVLPGEPTDLFRVLDTIITTIGSSPETATNAETSDE